MGVSSPLKVRCPRGKAPSTDTGGPPGNQALWKDRGLTSPPQAAPTQTCSLKRWLKMSSFSDQQWTTAEIFPAPSPQERQSDWENQLGNRGLELAVPHRELGLTQMEPKTVRKHLHCSLWQQTTPGFRGGLGRARNEVTNVKTMRHLRQNSWAGSHGGCAHETRARHGGPPQGPKDTRLFGQGDCEEEEVCLPRMLGNSHLRVKKGVLHREGVQGPEVRDRGRGATESPETMCKQAFHTHQTPWPQRHQRQRPPGGRGVGMSGGHKGHKAARSREYIKNP